MGMHVRVSEILVVRPSNLVQITGLMPETIWIISVV